MTLDLGQKGRGVFYINFETRGSNTETVVAKTVREFNFGNLIEHADDYVMAVERLFIPLQSIPMINSLTPALTFIPTGIGLAITINTNEAFSLREFLNDLNEQAANVAQNLFFRLNPAGRISIEYDDFVTNNITFNPILASIFDLEPLITIGDVIANNEVRGRTPMIDRFDQLHKIQLEALGFNSVQEIIDTNRSAPILTDILVPSSYSMSYVEDSDLTDIPETAFDVSYPVRQNVIYNASSERRFIVLKGKSPLQNLLLEAVAIYKDGTRNEIILRGNSLFDAKIAFFKR